MKWIIRGLAIAALAFLLTSTILFWVPQVQRKTGWFEVADGYFGDFGPTAGDCCGQPIEEQIKKRASLAERSKLEEISAELRLTDDEALLRMKAFEDVCINDLVDCRGLPSTKVKPFIEAILADRQRLRDVSNAQSARNANYVSAGSLFIAFVALIFAALSYFTRKPRSV